MTDILNEYSSALAVIDPVMGDNGKLYATFDESYPKLMLELCKNADIIISAVGKANMVDKSFVKNSKTCVFNIGFDFTPEGKMVGDCFNTAGRNVTPVPGGVGLLTRVALLKNVVKAYKVQNDY